MSVLTPATPRVRIFCVPLGIDERLTIFVLNGIRTVRVTIFVSTVGVVAVVGDGRDVADGVAGAIAVAVVVGAEDRVTMGF